MAAEEVSIRGALAALREGQARLEQRLDDVAHSLELTRRELREDIRDLRAEFVAIRNGQLAVAAATVAGLLGVIAALLVKL